MQLVPGGAESLGFIIPLCKIDEEKRLVYGRAAQETPDRAKEIMDYATAKPAFKTWSRTFEMATGGLSKGNLRSMHRKDSAAGKIVDIIYNDDEKAIDVCAKVVDEGDWRKCLEGVYTGFSIGGGYAGPKWDDPVHKGCKRYTPRLGELSLVDLPCIPTANFAELVKSGGVIEQLQLVGRVRTFAELWAETRGPEVETFGKRWAAAQASAPRTFADMWKP